jgi:hypothetical protein
VGRDRATVEALLAALGRERRALCPLEEPRAPQQPPAARHARQAAMEHGLSNARLEAINTTIRLLTRRA